MTMREQLGNRMGKWTAAGANNTSHSDKTVCFRKCIKRKDLTIAWRIPIAAQTYGWDAGKGQFPMKLLPDFVSPVSEVAKPGDMILAMCRSGGRSAIAVNLLAAAEFTQVYTIVDGMEGDAVKESDSVFLGQRLVSGWKNSGCPWTYKQTPDRMLLPKRQA